jgi:hypothetical protein
MYAHSASIDKYASRFSFSSVRRVDADITSTITAGAS